MIGKFRPRGRPSRAVLALGLAIGVLPVQGIGGEDQFAGPERIGAVSDLGRITQDVTVDVSVSKVEFVPLEPIALDVRARNLTDHVIFGPVAGFSPLGDYRTFRIKVFDRDGRLLPKTRYQEIDVTTRGFPLGASLGGALHLLPGHDVRRQLCANLVYDMTSPGEYTILVEFPTNSTVTIDGKAVPVVARSKSLDVLVVAEPPRLPTVDKSDAP